MTVPTTTSVVEYVSDGALKSFPTTFGFVQPADLRVSTLDTADPPVETQLAIGGDYTVTGGGRAAISGEVVLAVAATAGHRVRIRRVVELLQATDFKTQGAFWPEAHTAVADKLVHMAQQLNDGAIVAAGLFDFDGGDGTAATVLAAGTTTARALGSRLGEALSVRDFGAVGDDTEDDTDAIQGALDAAGAQDKPVFFPPGTYRVTASLFAPAHEGLGIYGCSGAAVHGVGFDGPILSVSGAAARGLEVRGLAFVGAGQAGTVDGISCANTSALRLDGLRITQCRRGLIVAGTTACRGFAGLRFELNGADLTFATSASSGLHFNGCLFVDSNKAVEQLAALANVSFVACTFAASRLAGSSTTPLSFVGYETRGLAFKRCRFEQGQAAGPAAITNLKIGGHATGIYGAGPVLVEDCIFSGASALTHIHIAPYSDEVRIVGNVFDLEPASEDVLYNSVHAPVIEHNLIPQLAQRECSYTVTGLSPRLSGRISCRRVHSSLTLQTLTGGAGAKKVTWNLGGGVFQNAMTRVEIVSVDASTATLGGIALVNHAPGSVEVHYTVSVAGAADGSIALVAYGY